MHDAPDPRRSPGPRARATAPAGSDQTGGVPSGSAPSGSATAGAALAVGTSVALTVLAAVLDAGNDPAVRQVVAGDVGWTAGLAGTALVAPGAAVLRRAPRHLLGWVLVVSGLHWSVDGVAASWLVRAVQGPDVLPGAEAAFWLYNRLGAWLLLTLPLLLLLYPDGRLPGGRWRAASLLSLAATTVLPVSLVVVPARLAYAAEGEALPAPLVGLDLDPTTVTGLPDAFWQALLPTALVLVALSLVVPFAVVVVRYRRGGPQDRQRLRWLLWAGLVALVVMLTSAWLPDAWTSNGLVLAVTVAGAAAGIGVLRPGLVDIDALLGGTVVYVVLGAALLLTDLAVLAGAGLLLGDGLGERQAALLALAVVAAVYLPLRDRLWRLVRRLVVGGREDPYRVVAGLAEQLERSLDAQQELDAVARAVALAFRCPFVGVEVDQPDGSRLLASYGQAPDGPVQVTAVAYRGREIGRLVLPPRRSSTGGLSRRDERLLGDLVRQAAAAARAAHLAEALQRSRESLVAAREEERRRLRRDLHDGLGPSLGAVVLRIDTARNLARAGAGDEADGLLQDVRRDVAGALADVRRLVHDLRPPALDDVGLLGAVQQQADRLGPGTCDGAGVQVRVRSEGDLDALPAAVEVAAYRIASEALHNVVRHSGAGTAEVLLSATGGRLLVTVTDDGAGIAADAPAGVGLLSMKERAAELGGTCQVRCPAGGGTEVHAELPVEARTGGAPQAVGS